MSQSSTSAPARQFRKWTPEEDQRLLRQVRAFPHNLHHCFLMVSEEIDRTPSAVSAHWYSSLSKRPEALCFFTASTHSVSKNRKNGMGIDTPVSIWQRFLRILRSL